jgi:hypothetical protein
MRHHTLPYDPGSAGVSRREITRCRSVMHGRQGRHLTLVHASSKPSANAQGSQADGSPEDIEKMAVHPISGNKAGVRINPAPG